MHQPCPYCHGKGLIKSSLQLSVDIQRRLISLIRLLTAEKKESDLQICVHPAILERLRTEDEEIIKNLQVDYKGRLSFKSDPLRQAESFSIIDATSGQTLFAAGEQRPV